MEGGSLEAIQPNLGVVIVFIYSIRIYNLSIDHKDDEKAFIFTLKNPHRVPPTRYMERIGSNSPIDHEPNCGPIFGYDLFSDIYIGDHCNKKNNCSISNGHICAYNFHPKYKSSLFAHKNIQHEENSFSMLDYEVYTIKYRILLSPLSFCCFVESLIFL